MKALRDRGTEGSNIQTSNPNILLFRLAYDTPVAGESSKTTGQAGVGENSLLRLSGGP